MPWKTRALHLLSVLVIASTLAGCSGMMPRHFGIRPDEPGPGASACEEYKALATYALELQEAFRTRAVGNRWSIYLAATIGLGVIAASGGLAAASAASLGTLALLSVSGGFASGFFAVLDNATIADIYTVSVTRIATTKAESDSRLQADASGNRYTDQNACTLALHHLHAGLADITNTMERARTDSAIAAVIRAQAQQQKLNQLVGQVQASSVTVTTRRATISAVTPAQLTTGGPRDITLTVVNANFQSVGFGDVKVKLGSRTYDAHWAPPDADGAYHVKFDAPANPPDPPEKRYRPVLLVGRTEEQIVGPSRVELVYQ